MHLLHLLSTVLFTNSLLRKLISLLWLNSSPYFQLPKKVPGVSNPYKGTWRQMFLIVPSSENNSKLVAVQVGKFKAVNLTGYSCCSANPTDKNSEMRFVSSVFSCWLVLGSCTLI